MDLSEIRHFLDCGWDLHEADQRDPRTHENALKAEFSAFTSLRNAELHAVRPCDILWEKGLVRVGMAAKGAKPRLAAFVNGLADSPTLEKVRELVEDRKRRRLSDTRPIWRSGESAWHHWMCYRAGPYSGLQRPIEALTGEGRKRLWRIHPHTMRAAFVMICRRAPLERGLEPLSWQSIAQLGGWESSAVVEKYYYVCDLPGVLLEVGTKLASLAEVRAAD